MTMDFNKLKAMTQPQLVDLARQMGVEHHHKNTAETLVSLILNKLLTETQEAKPKQEVKPAKPVAIFLTQDQLEEKLAAIKERYPSFSTKYDDENRCVTLRYFDGKYRHSETMSLSAPLTKFLRKAQEIASGPLVLRPQAGDWDKLPQKGQTPDIVL